MEERPAVEASIVAANRLCAEGRYVEAFDTCIRQMSPGQFDIAFQTLLLRITAAVPEETASALTKIWLAKCGLGNLDVAEVVLTDAFADAPNSYGFFANFAGLSILLGRHHAAERLFANCLTEDLPAGLGMDDIHSKYAAAADPYDANVLHETSIDEFFRFLLPRLGPVGGLDVIDACCGTGLAAAAVRPFAKTLIGIDLSEAMLSSARKLHLYDDLVLGDVVERLYGLSADLIICSGAMYYFRESEPFARAVSRSLRQGGLFAFSEFPAPAGVMATTGATLRYCRSPDYIRGMMTRLGMEEVDHAAGICYRLPGHYWLFRKTSR